MRAITPIIAAALVSLASCGSENEKEAAHSTSSYELSLIHTANCSDTINQIYNGLKQGVWINKTSHDTTVYLNDTVYSVTAPMTSGEMLRTIKEKGNQGMLNLPNNFGAK